MTDLGKDAWKTSTNCEGNHLFGVVRYQAHVNFVYLLEDKVLNWPRMNENENALLLPTQV